MKTTKTRPLPKSQEMPMTSKVVRTARHLRTMNRKLKTKSTRPPHKKQVLLITTEKVTKARLTSDSEDAFKSPSSPSVQGHVSQSKPTNSDDISLEAQSSPITNIHESAPKQPKRKIQKHHPKDLKQKKLCLPLT